MLGQDLVPFLEPRHTVIPLTRSDADITDGSKTAAVIVQVRPDAVVHAAAFTAVDLCESQPELAMRVNGAGTRHVALACRELNVPMLYLGTDYVFDGEKNGPYVETDTAGPLGVYGKSKLEGERQVSRLLERHWIVRSSWLFGPHGKNFVRSILDQAKGGAALRVVNDQVGSPTYTEDLAAGLAAILERGTMGTYHMSNQGFCSWYEFAQEILRQVGMDPSGIVPISTAALNRPAPRPKNSRLANARLAAEGFPLLPPWQKALHRYLVRTNEIRA
jgi:dTDP-4-dehydrorhamnose reductase